MPYIRGVAASAISRIGTRRSGREPSTCTLREPGIGRVTASERSCAWRSSSVGRAFIVVVLGAPGAGGNEAAARGRGTESRCREASLRRYQPDQVRRVYLSPDDVRAPPLRGAFFHAGGAGASGTWGPVSRRSSPVDLPPSVRQRDPRALLRVRRRQRRLARRRFPEAPRGDADERRELRVVPVQRRAAARAEPSLLREPVDASARRGRRRAAPSPVRDGPLATLGRAPAGAPPCRPTSSRSTGTASSSARCRSPTTPSSV